MTLINDDGRPSSEGHKSNCQIISNGRGQSLVSHAFHVAVVSYGIGAGFSTGVVMRKVGFSDSSV